MQPGGHRSMVATGQRGAVRAAEVWAGTSALALCFRLQQPLWCGWSVCVCVCVCVCETPGRAVSTVLMVQIPTGSGGPEARTAQSPQKLRITPGLEGMRSVHPGIRPKPQPAPTLAPEGSTIEEPSRASLSCCRRGSPVISRQQLSPERSL